MATDAAFDTVEFWPRELAACKQEAERFSRSDIKEFRGWFNQWCS
jgi:hypothetical protein